MAMDATFTAEEQYRRGKSLLADGRNGEALACFRAAHQIDRANPRYRSHYGLGLALVERRLDKALELCRSAAKEEFYNPELYHNLARVHMAFGFKSEAIRYLRRGLMIDPANRALAEDLLRLGRRQLPVLQFLPRNHPVNRWLGRLRSRFHGFEPPPPAEAAGARS
jgi:tetratricopeptide (TPR) repeat protein